ncbi:MAG: 1-deoxy-D-xylulose-5-phosphate reductoisomerase [Vampirovibrionales bacterium]
MMLDSFSSSLVLASEKYHQTLSACHVSGKTCPARPFRIAVLGATGSIGVQTLEVIAAHPEWFELVAISGATQTEKLYQLTCQYTPRWVVAEDVSAFNTLRSHESPTLEAVLQGHEGLLATATHPDVDWVVIGLVGMRGLIYTLEALKQGKQVLTGNKETFVAGGHLVEPYLAQIVPFDSEHSALFQCLASSKNPSSEVSALWLTASGGGLRDWSLEQLAHVTPKDALTHPNWVMGAKVTVDSASLMNKALEVIEAHWLFSLPYENIKVRIHPQSLVHSAVSYQDGALLAQIGRPDMRQPIQYALSYPYRLPATSYGVEPLGLDALSQLTFLEPCAVRYPFLPMAYHVGQTGGSLACVFNAMGEWLVPAFLKGTCTWLEMPQRMERILEAYMKTGLWEASPSFEALLATQAWVKHYNTTPS